MVLYRSKADGVDRLQAGDLIEAEDLDNQIRSTNSADPLITVGSGKLYFILTNDQVKHQNILGLRDWYTQVFGTITFFGKPVLP